MAEYTITVLSKETSVYFERSDIYIDGWQREYTDSAFNFDLGNLKNTVIKSISVTAPVTGTRNQGGYGNFTLKLGNTTLETWTDSETTVWSKSGLSVNGTESMTASVDLKHTDVPRYGSYSSGLKLGTQGRTFGQATATLVVSMDNPISATSPTNGQVFNRSANIQTKWTNLLIGSSTFPVSSQTLYWKYSAADSYNSINVGTTATSYTFPAGFYSFGTIQWYISTTDNRGQRYSSSVMNFQVVNDFVVRASSPSDYQKFSRNSVVQLRWTNSYIDSTTMSVTSQKLYWKYSTALSYNVVNLGTAVTTYTFQPGVFTDGDIKWFILSEDNHNFNAGSSELTFTVANDFSVKLSAPSDGKSYLRTDSIQFKWTNSTHSSTSVSVKSQTLRWKYENETTTHDINVGASATSYTMAAGNFRAGTVNWWVISVDNYNYSIVSNVYSIVISNNFTIEPVSPMDGQTISSSLANTFSWTNSMIGNTALALKSQTLYWKNRGASSYTSINVGTSASTYTFNAKTFSNGSIQWYIKSVDKFDYAVSTPVQTVYVGVTPSVAIAYPSSVNIRSSNQQIFTWEMLESIATGQKSYTLKYKKDGEDWVTISNTSSNQYHTFAPDTFVTGTYTWQVSLVNNDNIQTQVVSATFEVIGATAAPNITNITNSAIPIVTWEIPSQDTFELEIHSTSERVYVSGVQPGANIRTFTPNIMLPDGNYIVKMRAMNEYGYFTKWSEYSFILDTSKPDPVECIAYANTYHGINVEKGSGVAGTLYVIRRKFGEQEWKIMQRLDADGTYIDNSVVSGEKYEYALRNYFENQGYSDSNIATTIIDFPGSIIYDGNEFVHLYKTENSQFDVSHSPAKSFTYSYTIGRTYPVRESSDWLSHTTSLSCFVTYEEYEKLTNFYISNDDLWFKGNKFSFKCSIDSITIKETLLGEGYTINISLSRTDEDEVRLVE